MTKITGRPPKAIKQEKNIGFFVTHAQHAIIQEKAAQAKVNISDYMRQMAVNGYVRIRWTEEDVALLKQLAAFSNDLHEMVGIAEREGVLNAMIFFGKYRDKIDKIIKELQHDRKGIRSGPKLSAGVPLRFAGSRPGGSAKDGGREGPGLQTDG